MQVVIQLRAIITLPLHFDTIVRAVRDAKMHLLLSH